MVQRDWDKVRKNVGNLVPVGGYLMEVTKCTTGANKDGSELWVVGFEIVDGGAHDGRIVNEFLRWNEKGEDAAFRALEALGVELVGNKAVTPDDIIGRRCACAVIHDDFTGDMQARPLAFGRGFFKENEVEKARAAAAKWAAKKAAENGAPAAGKSAEPETVDPSSVPF